MAEREKLGAERDKLFFAALKMDRERLLAPRASWLDFLA
jgi:hypothetical protein